MEVEREVVDLYRAFFLRDRIGDVFEGTISGVDRASASSSSSTIRSSRGWSASRRCPTTTTSSTSRPAGWWGGARGARSRSATPSRSRCSRSASSAARSTSRCRAPRAPPRRPRRRSGRKRGRRGAAARRGTRRRAAARSRPARGTNARTARAVRTSGARAARREGKPGARSSGGNRRRRQAEEDARRRPSASSSKPTKRRCSRRSRRRAAPASGRAAPEPPDPVRPIFQHDRDRIIHSKAFRRLAGKTQVFLAPEGDHYRTRITHTLEVAQIARTVTRALRLNESLTEAIVMGHDLGPHAVRPRGREGAGQADARRLSPRQAVAARRRGAGARRAGA